MAGSPPSGRTRSRVSHGLRALAMGCVLLVFGSATLVALAELGLRGFYWYAFSSTEQAPLIYERVYWVVPPWVSRTTVLYDDAELGLWMKPGANRTYLNLFGPIGSLDDVGDLFDELFPKLPAWASRRPVWHLRTNAAGLRGDELPTRKSADTFRIVVMGDSWTVGINVEEELTYPAVLRDLLDDGVSGAKVEVLNFGVIGGAAESGVRLLPRVLALSPDLVVVAYAQNDEGEARDPRPKLVRPVGQLARGRFRWATLLGESELYRLYQWWHTPRTDRVAATLQHELTRLALPPSNEPGRMCPNPAFATTRYFAALDRIAGDLTTAGVPVVLLYNNVPDFVSHCTLSAMQQIARARALPVVDSSRVLEDLEGALTAEREQRLGLTPTAPTAAVKQRRGIDAVFRVDLSSEPPGTQPYVFGNALQLASFTPNQLALHDDATHGDQVAGDGVWSRLVHFDAPQIVTYAFSSGTVPGTWSGLENYHLRAYALRDTDERRTVYLPIEQFGVHTLRSDSSHPDAAGHRAIAAALATTLRTAPSFASFAHEHAVATAADTAAGDVARAAAP
jgi:lysophospholipase L1-like esterase